MSRRFLPVIWAFTLLFMMMQAPAQAASYVVAPFSVSGPQGYSYLGQAIPSMLTSRLFLQGQFEPAERQDAALREKAPASRNAASAMGKKFGADYVVWGSVTVMGDQASLDVSALSPDGKIWKNASTSPVNSLLAGLQNVADAVNTEVFGRTDVVRASAAAGGPASPNGAFVMNEARGRVENGQYLNPSLRYQGTEDAASQIRSQMLPFECLGMEVADLDGNGSRELLLLSEYALYAYRWENGNKLTEIGRHRIPASARAVTVRAFTQNKQTYLALSCFDESDNGAYSQILQFRGGKFEVAVDHVSRYLNVVKLPPLYEERLIGQDSDRSKVVAGPVHEMYLEGSELRRGGKIANLPKEANLYNFAWIPAAKGKRGDHLALIADNETLLTFNDRGKRLAGTEDMYSGSSVYIEGDRGLGSISVPDNSSKVLYYVPMRMPVVDLDRNGDWELLANKPITAAGKLFSNYRTYPQGEIHAMVWDGMGMELLWKTRRIKGTVCDLAVADVNNNGRIDLAVAVNAYAGITSGVKTRCAVYLYPLDTTKVNAKPNYQE